MKERKNMKICSGNDLHLSFGELTLNNDDNAEVLCLNGDICELVHIEKYIPFFEDVCSKWKHVIYVLGNHEFYDTSIQKGYAIASSIPIPNLYVLNNEVKVIEDVTFLGCTLWTDMNKNHSVAKSVAHKNMNDFRYIKYNDKRLTPEDTIVMHDESVAFLKKSLKEVTTNKVVVTTHHAPHYKSIDPMYHGSLINYAFYSDLENLILDNKIDFWLHGHCHSYADYYINNTRIINNPRGYFKREKISDNFNLLTFEI
jgi:Icc-related predicted phosphoesterase